MSKRLASKIITQLGSVTVGDSFRFCTKQIFGSELAIGSLPPFEDQVLTVVAFRPNRVNSVVVRDPNGIDSLMPLDMVEKGMRVSPVQKGRVQ